MKNNKPARIQSIVDDVLPGLLKQETTMEEVLAAYPEQAEQLRLHLKSALWISSQQARLDPNPGTLDRGRQRLVRVLKANAPRNFWERFWRSRSPQRFAIQSLSLALLVLSVAFFLNTIFLASRLALPGDTLYPVKLGFEQIQLTLIIDPQEQARRQIDFTQQRTTEIVQLVLEDDYAHMPEAVNRLKIQIDRAVCDLDAARAEDAIQAVALAESMETMLRNEAFILTLLRDMKPTFAYVGLNQAIAVTINSLTAMQN
jgi:hypothetical protein